MNWNWVESKADFYDFLAQVIVCAPDDFIEVDYLPPEDQLDLDKAFVELNRGMCFIAETVEDPEELRTLQALLDEALSAYRKGEQIRGAHLLQDFERFVFK